MNVIVGVQIIDVGFGWVSGECFDILFFCNYLGIIYVGVQFLFVEVVSGVVFVGVFVQYVGEVVLFIEKFEMYYVGCVVGDLIVCVEIDFVVLFVVYVEYQVDGCVWLFVKVMVKDGEDKLVMEVQVYWYLCCCLQDK